MGLKGTQVGVNNVGDIHFFLDKMDTATLLGLPVLRSERRYKHRRPACGAPVKTMARDTSQATHMCAKALTHAQHGRE